MRDNEMEMVLRFVVVIAMILLASIIPASSSAFEFLKIALVFLGIGVLFATALK